MQYEYMESRLKRGQTRSRQRNLLPSEELLCSGPFRFRCSWDWAKLPPALDRASFSGLAWSGEGRLYAATNAPDCPVAVFAADGSFLKKLGDRHLTGAVHGVCLSGDGTLWLSSQDRHIVLRYDKDGRLLGALGSCGLPSDSGINDDCAPSRWRYQTIRRLAGPFHAPTGLAAGPDGELFVADGYGNAAVHRFDSGGALLRTWGGMGKEPGRFTIPHDLCVDGRGRVLVADCEADRVQVFRSDGELLAVIGGLLYPLAVAADAQFLYVAEREGRITILDYDLTVLAQLGFYASHFAAHSLAVDTHGNLYFSSLLEGGGLYKLERLAPGTGRDGS
ncbi:MAG: hypothetical protein Q4E38_04265 [Eubacteriales bacterium]|nr:hypothetical protein [Eubacteriales bacterium]